MTAKPSPAEILAEPAGPRLDGWVAEIVMGWAAQAGRAFPHWVNAAGEETAPCKDDGLADPPIAAWSPSADAADLWGVVLALHARRWVLALSPAGATIGPFGYDATETVKAKGPDEALAAACKAALLAAVGGYLA